MTAWDQPCLSAYWGGTPEQLCAATRAGHCLPPGAVLHEDKDAKRIPRSWATGSPELKVPDPNPAGHAGSTASQQELLTLRVTLLRQACTFSHPQSSRLCQGLCSTRQLENDRGTEAMDYHRILVHPSPFWVQPAQHRPGISGHSLLRSDTPQPWATPLQPLTAALRISFCYHSVNIIKSN